MDKLSTFRAMTRNVRTSTTIALWVCVLVAIGLFISSFIVPPTGVIDPSVLKAGGIIFAIMALIIGREAIMEGMGVKMTYGNTSVEIRDTDGPGGHGHEMQEHHEHHDR